MFKFVNYTDSSTAIRIVLKFYNSGFVDAYILGQEFDVRFEILNLHPHDAGFNVVQVNPNGSMTFGLL